MLKTAITKSAILANRTTIARRQWLHPEVPAATVGKTMVEDMAPKHPDILFLAQLPPPVHGVTVVSERVACMLEESGAANVERRWQGGARSLTDIGTKNFSKVRELIGLAVSLVSDWVRGRRYDAAYLTFTPWSHAAIRDAGLAWLAGLLAPRVLVHLHTEGLGEVLQSGSLRARIIRALLRKSELVAITEETAQMAERAGLFSRVNRLANMAERPVALEGRGRREREATGAVHCAYLGNYDERKGIYDFVDVIGALKSDGACVTATIAGGPSRFVTSQNLADYIAGRGLGDDIDVHGFVDDDVKSRLLQEADLFIYPTRHDHAPLVLLEAMAHGAVPITLDAGGIRSLMGAGLAENVFDHTAEPRSVRQWMVERVKDYIGDPKRLERARAVTTRHFEDHFSEGRFRASLYDLFNVEPVSRSVAHTSRPAQPYCCNGSN